MKRAMYVAILMGASSQALAQCPRGQAEGTLELGALEHKSSNCAHVPQIRTVLARGPGGKPDRFTDAGNREFQIRYRADERIEAVRAVRGRHASDIEQIVYAPSGEILEVRFGNGYVLHYVYSDEGVLLIRDRYGGVITRSAREPAQAVQKLHSDPTGKLAPTVAVLDALLVAAAAPRPGKAR